MLNKCSIIAVTPQHGKFNPVLATTSLIEWNSRNTDHEIKFGKVTVLDESCPVHDYFKFPKARDKTTQLNSL